MPGVELAIFSSYQPTCLQRIFFKVFFKFFKLGLREPLDSYPKLAIGLVNEGRPRVLVSRCSFTLGCLLIAAELKCFFVVLLLFTFLQSNKVYIF